MPISRRFTPALVLRLAVLCLAVLNSARSSGQQTINNGSITGTVLDSSGALLGAAEVTVRETSTNVTSRETTGRDARFRFPYLPAGHYEVVATRAGFAGRGRELDLTIGAVFDLPITLPVAGAQSSVTIDATPAVVETRRSQVAGTVLEPEVSELPYNGRNFLDLALLLPGVSPTNTASTQLFAETSAVAGQGISISSQRNFSNNFIVDGLSANDDAAGLVQTSYGMDVVREMQVVTNGAQAEFGRALGGYINFVTRSGENQMHGDLYGYLRNRRLNAANPLSGRSLPLTQAQFGASLDGPILRDRTFFFTNFEQRNLNQSGLIAIAGANAIAINRVLQTSGYQGPLLAIDQTSPATLYPNPVRTTNFFAKVDHSVRPGDFLGLRYSLYRLDSLNSRGVGSTSYISAGAALQDLDQTGAFSNIATFSPRTVNETRGQFVRSRLDAPANDPIGPAVSISGVATFGTLSSSPTGRYDLLYELVDNLSHQAGPHALRAGVDVLHNSLTITYPQSIRGSYAFASLANFSNATYSTFTQSFGNETVAQSNPNLGLFVQDEWRIGPALTVNAGLRYDLQFLEKVATDTTNVSPRLGLAWTPFVDKRSVVRASYGLFYDRVPLRALSNALQSSGNTRGINDGTFVNLSLSYGQTSAPSFPGTLTGYTGTNLPSRVRVNLTTMDPHLQNAYSGQFSLEVEQEFTPRSTLAVSYQHLQSNHLLVSINQNTPTCTSAVDPVNLCRPDPSLGNVKQYSSAASGHYDALAVSYLQRPASWGSYRLSYTWSKAVDNVGEFFFSAPVNNSDLAVDRSRSDDDQRHRLVFDAALHSPVLHPTGWAQRLYFGFSLSGVLQFYSAPPFNIVTGGNTVQTTSQRPCTAGYSLASNAGLNPCTQAVPGAMIGRNAGTGFDLFNLNARLSRTFPVGERLRLEAIAEAFNALNHRNDEIPNATFGAGSYPSKPAPGFGRATAVADPRSVQLALRLSF